MRIVITGGAGFIGSHLHSELNASGHGVVVLDREPYDLFGRPTGAVYDLLEPELAHPTSFPLDQIIRHYDPEVVVHLAAQVGRQFGEDAPAIAALDNVGMTALVARSCAKAGVRLVYASTSEVYGDLDDDTAVENRSDEQSHPPARWSLYRDLPHNVYGLTKRQAEEVAALYATKHGEGAYVSSGAGLQVVRPSMPYGPGLPPGRGRAAIVTFLWQAHHGTPMTVHLGAERSWCWIGDCVRGIRDVIEVGEVATTYDEWRRGRGCYNVGRDDDARSMEAVAELALAIAAPGSVPCPDTVQLVSAPGRQTIVKRLSTAKLRALDWEPLVDLEDGMQRTYDWLVAYDWQGVGRP